MKIIVDEMPKSAGDCVFGTGEDDHRCVINNRNYCYSSVNCPYLKPMTDYYVEERISQDMVRHLPIRSVRFLYEEYL